MKKKIRLTPEQKKLVERHLSIVYWIIRENISVNGSAGILEQLGKITGTGQAV